MSDIANGRRSLYAAHAVAMASALRVPLDWLLDETVEPSWPPSRDERLRPAEVLARMAEALGLSPAEAAALLLGAAPGSRGLGAVETPGPETQGDG